MSGNLQSSVISVRLPLPYMKMTGRGNAGLNFFTRCSCSQTCVQNASTICPTIAQLSCKSCTECFVCCEGIQALAMRICDSNSHGACSALHKHFQLLRCRYQVDWRPHQSAAAVLLVVFAAAHSTQQQLLFVQHAGAVLWLQKDCHLVCHADAFRSIATTVARTACTITESLRSDLQVLRAGACAAAVRESGRLCLV